MHPPNTHAAALGKLLLLAACRALPQSFSRMSPYSTETLVFVICVP
jgi:hypothetical protein